jgi:hypothetical protein
MNMSEQEYPKWREGLAFCEASPETEEQKFQVLHRCAGAIVGNLECELGTMLGRTLTAVEASMPDGQQCQALKSIIRAQFSDYRAQIYRDVFDGINQVIADFGLKGKTDNEGITQ